MKIINFPNIKEKPSVKLEIFLKKFFNQIGVSYYNDDVSSGIYCTYFRMNNEICVEQKVVVRANDYICYTTLSIYIEPCDYELYSGLSVFLNELNSKIEYGNFLVDSKNGEIKFKSYYEPNNSVTMEGLDKLLGYPRYILDQYGKEIRNFFSNGEK